MPIGKSGRYHMNPNEMRRHGDDPGEAKPVMGNSRPEDEEQSGEGAEGDGNHHHEIHMHEDGTAHSVHTDPEGKKDTQDHGSYDEAKDHMDAMMKPEGDQDEAERDNEGGDGSDDDGEDMAGMYAEDCNG